MIRCMPTYNFKRTGQVSLDENVGMQSATYGINMAIIESYADDGSLKIEVCGSSWHTPVEGDVNTSIQLSLVADGQVKQTLWLKPYFNSYFTSPGTNFVGEAYFNTINVNTYSKIDMRIQASWFVEVSPGHRNLPTYPGTISILPIGVNGNYSAPIL